MISACHVSGQELARYRDREGSAAQLIQLEEHISGCERCKLRLADAEALSQLFGDQLQQIEQELPPNLAASIMSKIGSAAPRRSWLERLAGLLPPRRELTFGLIGLAVAASLAIVFAPLASKPGRPSSGDNRERGPDSFHRGDEPRSKRRGLRFSRRQYRHLDDAVRGRRWPDGRPRLSPRIWRAIGRAERRTMIGVALIVALRLGNAAASDLVLDVQVIEASNNGHTKGGQSKAIRDLGATLNYKSFRTLSQEQRTLTVGEGTQFFLPDGAVAHISALGIDEKRRSGLSGCAFESSKAKRPSTPSTRCATAAPSLSAPEKRRTTTRC